MHKPGGNSRPVISNQRSLHPGLATTVRRHLHSTWRKPAQAADAMALETLANTLRSHAGPIVLDSFCGTGQSSALLAQRYPQALVIGVDKSAQRLAKHQRSDSGADYLLLQAHCEAVWRLLAAEGRTLLAHYLLYPNPWPKASQLSRRIHGHPAFPLLMQLGGTLELRSNWQIYVEEFGVALHLAGTCARIGQLAGSEDPLTRFERKYRDSGHTLWQLQAQL